MGKCIGRFLCALAMCVGFACTACASPGDLIRMWEGPAPYPSHYFGFAVATDGNRLVVGSPFYNNPAMQMGIVYIMDANTTALLHTLNNPTPGPVDHFGYSVATVQGFVAVGVHNDNAGSGSVCLFNLSDGTLARTIFPPPGKGGMFGESVTPLGNNLIIGSPTDSTSGTGTVYIYDPATGSQLLSIPNPEPGTSSDLFGKSVAVVGGSILVGAQFDDVTFADEGSAYLFDGATGGLLLTIRNPDPATNDRFGSRVGALGNDLIVGAYGDSITTSGDGAVYIFNGTTGALVRRIDNPNPDSGDSFGFSIATAGNQIAVGSYRDDYGAYDSGRVYVFDGRTGGLLYTIDNPAPQAGAYFGIEVEATGDDFLVGCTGRSGVYQFEGIATSARTEQWSEYE